MAAKTALHEGDLLGDRYQLVSPLAKGGMATVWRARDQHLGREVAVKLLTHRLAGDPAAAARLHIEAQAVARLSHPHIQGRRAPVRGRLEPVATGVEDLHVVEQHAVCSLTKAPRSHARPKVTACEKQLGWPYTAQSAVKFRPCKTTSRTTKPPPRSNCSRALFALAETSVEARIVAPRPKDADVVPVLKRDRAVGQVAAVRPQEDVRAIGHDRGKPRVELCGHVLRAVRRDGRLESPRVHLRRGGDRQHAGDQHAQRQQRWQAA
ncbi:MAG TPA: hypothetical protein VFC19_51940 [Candidatus Limnocylindrales bacterium]|nr:hypothetical protein [Candidatus Limnocylindrales bacterium]